MRDFIQGTSNNLDVTEFALGFRLEYQDSGPLV
jgi:hypothetical protein